MNEVNSKKWYDNKALLIALFFFLPPVGLYAMIKHKTDLWKKVLYIVPTSLITLFITITIIGAIFIDIDYYKDGLDHYNKKQFAEAYNDFKKVTPNDENYNDAMLKLNELEPIIENLKSIAIEKEKMEIEKIAKENEEKEKQIELEKNPQLAYPLIQQDFINVINQYKTEYNNAPNELKKSAVKTQRGNQIKETLGNTRVFTEWVAIVSSMGTTTEGNAMLKLKVEGTDITLMTMNNEFSDIFGNTLIKQTDPLYNVIAELNENDKIIVSGTFIETDKNDYIMEASLTELGSMGKPEFIAKFRTIKKY